MILDASSALQSKPVDVTIVLDWVTLTLTADELAKCPWLLRFPDYKAGSLRWAFWSGAGPGLDDAQRSSQYTLVMQEQVRSQCLAQNYKLIMLAAAVVGAPLEQPGDV